MSNFLTRTITGALFVAVMIGGICYSYWSMAALFLIISVLGLWEFYTLLEKANHSPQKFTGILLSITGYVFFSYYAPRLGNLSAILLFYFPPLMGLILIAELFRSSGQPLQNTGLTILGIIYVTFPFLLLNLVSCGEPGDLFTFKYDYWKLLGFFFLTWSNDTFAYLIGRAFGKTKLAEHISPKKTWEGTIGGGLLTLGAAYIISLYFTEIALVHWLAIAAIVTITGTLGDLVESMFKRSLNVKDSGSILPGHGGILDRFDGVLLSSPFVFTYLLLIR